MLKKISVCFLIGSLSACSFSSYLPFSSAHKKTVINLEQSKIDKKSYATAYAATVETYEGRVDRDYYVNSFASGANDWYLGRILVPVEQIKEKLHKGGHDSNIYAYYSGVIHAAALQTNFGKLNAKCWSYIDTPSVTQGIYDAMLDLQRGKVRSENDEYIVQGSEELLKLCGGK